MNLKFLKLLGAGFVMFQKPSNYISYKSCKKWLKYEYPTDLIYGGINENINCEHLVPRFIIKKYNVEKEAEKDLHLLWLANGRLNSQRQHYKFDSFTADEKNIVALDEFGYTTKNKDYYHCRKHVKSQRFEPPVESRGIIARSVGYFYFTYNYECSNELLDIPKLIEWHKKYPVTSIEKEKNEKIYTIQKNKNIFIEKPFYLTFYFSPIMVYYRKIFPKNYALEK